MSTTSSSRLQPHRPAHSPRQLLAQATAPDAANPPPLATTGAYIASKDNFLDQPSPICQTPRSNTPNSSSSSQSGGKRQAPTPDSPVPAVEPADLSAEVVLDCLSLDHARPLAALDPGHERAASEAEPCSSPKRPRTSPGVDDRADLKTLNAQTPQVRRARVIGTQMSQLRQRLHTKQAKFHSVDHGRRNGGKFSRGNTLFPTASQRSHLANFERQKSQAATHLVSPVSLLKHKVSADRKASKPADIQMLREPEAISITQKQLAVEVHGIYSSLIVIENKCITIDAAQAADPTAKLDPEQNQALIALHRTLLYEHHDFMMATQHPSATASLRGLPARHNMPARMWKHGIHSFLEILRHRRPDSQDHMMAYIYLSYQMIALLFETVPSFTDTWLECLGDLARYRMAIEEERELHSIWGSIAASWYSTAADRHPEIGRLNHHLGILERPSLRKLHLYSKSLTCESRFPNALNSLTTLYQPIVSDDLAGKGAQSAEARLVTFLAHVFLGSSTTTVNTVAFQAISKLERLPGAKINDLGVFVVTTLISALLQLGLESNLLWQIFCTAAQTSESIIDTPSSSDQPDPPSESEVNENKHDLTATKPTTPAALSLPAQPTTSATSTVMDFSYRCFDSLIRARTEEGYWMNSLPSVHTLLVWFHSLHTVRKHTDEDTYAETYRTLTNSAHFSWARLGEYLNALVQRQPIKPHILEAARTGQPHFPTETDDLESKESAQSDPKVSAAADRPLPEDYQIRGLAWAKFYFPPGWFIKHEIDPDDRLRHDSSVLAARVDRVQWLALSLALHTDHLDFDDKTKRFTLPCSATVPRSFTIGSEDDYFVGSPATASSIFSLATVNTSRTMTTNSSVTVSAPSEYGNANDRQYMAYDRPNARVKHPDHSRSEHPQSVAPSKVSKERDDTQVCIAGEDDWIQS